MMNFGPQKKLEVHGKARREAARRRNSECSRPTAVTGRRRGAATNAPRRRPITARCTAVSLLPLLREEFLLLKLILHSELRRRAASRRALPCPSSYNIYGLSSCVKDNKSDWVWYLGLKLLGLQYMLLLLRFYVFLRFFENPKKTWLFTFFALLHTFSRTMNKREEICTIIAKLLSIYSPNIDRLNKYSITHSVVNLQ